MGYSTRLSILVLILNAGKPNLDDGAVQIKPSEGVVQVHLRCLDEQDEIRDRWSIGEITFRSPSLCGENLADLSGQALRETDADTSSTMAILGTVAV